MEKERNILQSKLEICSKEPLTGFTRNGYCTTGPMDKGTHTVCAKIDEKFLEFSKARNNDLTKVVKPGDHWCLCENRWNEAYESGEIMAPLVKKSATNLKTNPRVRENIKNQYRGKTRKRLLKYYQGGKRKTQKQFLYNPNDPKKSFDVYIDKDPSDTIPIAYSTPEEVKQTIEKLERLYKSRKYSHKRIWQVGMIMKVRLEAMLKHHKTMYPKAKYVKKRFQLANKYFRFLGKRTKEKEEQRRKMTFVF